MNAYLPTSKSRGDRRFPMLRLSERNPLVGVFPMSLNDKLTRLYNRDGFICAAECLRAATSVGRAS
jgi:hypothetical protein